MQEQKECLSALFFVNLDWTLKEFKITKEEAQQLIDNLQSIQRMDFVEKVKKKILRLKAQFSINEISQKVGLPLNVVKHILSQSLQNQQESIEQSNQENIQLKKLKLNSSIQQKNQNLNQQKMNKREELNNFQYQSNQQKEDKADKQMVDQVLQEEIFQQFEEFLKQQGKKENSQNTKKRQRKEEKKKIIILPQQVNLNKIIYQNQKQNHNKHETSQEKLAQFNDQKEKKKIEFNKIEIQNAKLVIDKQQEEIRLVQSGIVVKDQNQNQVYMCLFCDKKFKEESDLSQHLIDCHAQEKKIKLFCPQCHTHIFENIESYNNHLDNHQNQGETIKYTVQQIKEFQLLEIKRKFQQFIEIEQQPKKYQFYTNLQGNLLVDKLFGKQINEEYSSDESTLYIETKKHQQVETENILKDQEQEAISNFNELGQKQKIDKIRTNKSLKELKKENSKVLYGTIIYDKDDNILYQCKECQDLFSRNLSLQKHFQKNHPEAQLNEIICQICEKPFSNRKQFLMHLVKHLAKKQNKTQFKEEMKQEIEEKEEDNSQSLNNQSQLKNQEQKDSNQNQDLKKQSQEIRNFVNSNQVEGNLEYNELDQIFEKTKSNEDINQNESKLKDLIYEQIQKVQSINVQKKKEVQDINFKQNNFDQKINQKGLFKQREVVDLNNTQQNIPIQDQQMNQTNFQSLSNRQFIPVQNNRQTLLQNIGSLPQQNYNGGSLQQQNIYNPHMPYHQQI